MIIFSNDIEIDLISSQYATMVMGQKALWLPSGEMMNVTQLGSSYKYMKILETERIKDCDMKEKTNEDIGFEVAFEAERLKRNFGYTHSSSVWRWNIEVDRSGAKGDGQLFKELRGCREPIIDV